MKYEEAAEIVTVTGWACKKCKRWWGKDEHGARWCCSTDQPCDCGGRKEKNYVYCSKCRDAKKEQRWLSKPEKDWDGISPIAIDDEYFFDSGSLIDYLWDNELMATEAKIEHCEPVAPPEFDMLDFLCDCLPEDFDGSSLDDKDITKAVNDWIQSNGPWAWVTSGERVSASSLAWVEVELRERAKEVGEESLIPNTGG